MTDKGAAQNPKLHHVGIVMPSEDDVQAFMSLFGLVESYRGIVETWNVLCIFTQGNGATPIEFVVPNGGPLAKFNKGAGGLHHVALEVESLDLVRKRLAARNIGLLESEHIQGAGPFLCNFLSPVYTRGITVEFIQSVT